MFDFLNKIGQSEISQDLFSGDYSVSYHNEWGEDVVAGVFNTQEEAKAAAERYSKGFDSFSDDLLKEFID